MIPGRWALVAGIGNVFLGDDGFGVEVARQLLGVSLPEGVEVADFGIRALHLAYDLLDPLLELLVVVDAASHGAAPGTVYVFEPEAEEEALQSDADAHSMDLPRVFDTVRALGGRVPRTLIVGCEPEEIGESMGLSKPAMSAVGPAIDVIREIIAREPRSKGE
jgi:hydrogenase maturation protease